MTANTPKSRKAKGRVFQQKIREDILEVMDLDPKDILSTPMGQAGPDIYFAAKAQEEFPFAVECKHQDRLNLWDAIKQTEENAEKATDTQWVEEYDGDPPLPLIPLLVIKRSRGEPYAVIPWKEFLNMAEATFRRSGEH